jgi:hypothetical protein
MHERDKKFLQNFVENLKARVHMVERGSNEILIQ